MWRIHMLLRQSNIQTCTTHSTLTQFPWWRNDAFYVTIDWMKYNINASYNYYEILLNSLSRVIIVIIIHTLADNLEIFLLFSSHSFGHKRPVQLYNRVWFALSAATVIFFPTSLCFGGKWSRNSRGLVKIDGRWS